MKRFFGYLLTYILVTVFAATITWGVYMIVNGAIGDDDFVQLSAIVQSAEKPTPEQDKVKSLFKEEYRISYLQPLKFSFDYEGKHYVVQKEMVIAEEYYDTVPSLEGRSPSTSYSTGQRVTLYVNKNNPELIKLMEGASEKTVELKTVLYFAVPVYAIIMLLFTVSFAKKEKAIKKQKFYDKYGMNDMRF
ncbi:MAG: hypothetical protein J6U23_02685 [Clostridiales bacterium]|nr:hypothetical protein [Clostridiales bacterium]